MNKKVASAEPEVVQEKAEKKQDLMYLGPTIAGVAKHSTVFKNGLLPDKAKDCIKQLPMMEKLFVSLADMPAAIKELNKPSSVLRTVYAQVVNKFV